MSVLEKHVDRKSIKQAIDIQVVKLAKNLNLGYTLNDSQVKRIVEDLVDKYRTESIEDFMLAFKNALQGQYGTIYRLDSAVIFGWMDQYLDDKYKALEDSLYEKENEYKRAFKQNTDWFEVWDQARREADKKADEDGIQPGVRTVRQVEAYRQHLNSMTPDQIRKQGAPAPPKIEHHSTDQVYLNDVNARILACREKYLREKYPGATDEQIAELMN